MRYKILEYLKKSDDFVSGQELANLFNVSRTAVWKAVSSLKKEGYDITSVSNRGYLLKQEKDILNGEEIEYNGDFIFFDSVTSTNDVAKEYALKNCKEFFFVTCNQQTAGKGRLGRKWISPYNENIYISIVLKPEIAMLEVSQITLAIGLALCKTINTFTGLDAKLKWPNDIIVNGKKVCGILTEMQAEIERILFVVAGIGINVNQKNFEAEIAEKATSFFCETGKIYRRSDIISVIMEDVKHYYNIFYKKGFKAIKKEYLERCINLNKVVRATYRGETIIGEAVDISDNGELLIKTEQGIIPISCGEASVRLADNRYI